MVSRFKSSTTSMVLGDSTLESLTPSLNAPLESTLQGIKSQGDFTET